MYFKDIIGQEEAKRRLLQEVAEGRVAHARLLCGPEGSGKLPLAVAYARYLCCTNRQGDDACGTCPSCVKFNKLVHPDVHFVFPVKASSNVSDDFIREWRNLLLQTPYFSFPQWMEAMGVENQQPLIGVKESDEITRKLNLKSSAGGYKVMIIWLPEKMNVQSANKLLKLLEEPPRQTVFLLCKLDLKLSFLRSGTLGENVKNQRSAVDYPHSENILYVPHLYSRQLVVENYKLCTESLKLLSELLKTSASHARCRIK